MEQVHHDPDPQIERIESVLEAFEPFIGEHSKVEYYDSVWGFVFRIRMNDTHFRTCKQLWKFFGALFCCLTDNKHQNGRISVRCGEQYATSFNDFRRYVDFCSHYPYDNKRLIKQRLYPAMHDFGFSESEIGKWVESLFLYDNYHQRKENWKHPR